MVVQTLNSTNALVILEGFDEVISASKRKSIVSEIRKLCEVLINCRVIITSRTGDFEYHIDQTVQYELSPLTEPQIFEFSKKWLETTAEASYFVSAVGASPYSDTSIRPLTLSHLCAVYKRTGSIPEKPKTLYRKVVLLLVEEWDTQRSVVRLSKYAKFEADRKFEFISRFAYELKTSTFSIDLMQETYKSICDEFSLPVNEFRMVTAELENHTGLIVQSGVEQFEFAHKSLQEYLAAEYLVKLPHLPYTKDGLFERPNEIAIAVAISSNPSVYLTELVFFRFPTDTLPDGFASSFIERLILEKPDFKDMDILGIAILKLLSYEGGRKTETSYRLLKLTFKNNQYSYLRKFYKKVTKYNREVTLHIGSSKSDHGYSFPERLVLDESMWDSIKLSIATNDEFG